MAHFLRDEQISNVSISEDNLTQLSSVLEGRKNSLNADIPDLATSEKRAFLTYVIRFDNKGYRVFSLEDLLTYFRQAKSVERVIFTVETSESLRTNRVLGTLVELRLDEKDPNSSFLSVTSDNKDWVDASFSAVQDTLGKSRNRNGWVRTNLTVFGVQIIGVILGFILSLSLAAKLAPKLTIENPFLFSFLFILLIFSNTWTYLNQTILRVINTAFPSIKFLRKNKDRFHWLLQAVVGGIVAAGVLYVLNQAATLLLDVLGNLTKQA